MPGSKPTANDKLSFTSRWTFPGALGVRRTPHTKIRHQYLFISDDLIARASCYLHAIMLPLTFGAPALRSAGLFLHAAYGLLWALTQTCGVRGDYSR